ncbi:MAG TPA: MOSC N-terminal beta barrel domain-containing protein [Solirubrobacteraceae bacterium]|nr:MOSC N-terminal beta barrel domain-containing protein [Solirubrobacteraceae bacterium]
MASVVGLAFTPVKATRLHAVDRLELGPDGLLENRRFYVIDDRDRMINSKIVGELQTVIADYSHADRTLRLRLPDGRVLDGEVRLGDEVDTRFFSTQRTGRLVEGPWSEALSEVAGRPLRLVEPSSPGGGVDRGSGGAVSLISRASLARLAEIGGVESLDSRRFRMLIEIEGVDAHAEDRWVDNGSVRIGDAVVAFTGHVGRCLITSRDPESGVVDLPTLDLLDSYRGGGAIESTEPLPFGVWGRVVKPGTVRVGDEVAPLDG